MKKLAILGSTGSIGQSCLRVVQGFPDRFKIVSLSAGSNLRLLADQTARFQPEVVSIRSAEDCDSLRSLFRERGVPVPELLHGPEGLVAVATHAEADLLVSATVGVAGLPATYQAVCRGITLALANKEVLVAAGELVTAAARASGATILPVDSEHNGVHQCLRAGKRSEVRRLILTASGGPFRQASAQELENVTPEQALQHPTWRMGNRITIDSATLMNKGFEVIEACWLFGFTPGDVDVLIHPQSTVHAFVEYVDGSVVAQLSVTDMQVPIQYALTYPERWETKENRLDWETLRSLEFEKPAWDRFPCLGLAYQALRQGGSATCVLNAADEVAVEAFLAGKISFPGIARTIRDTLEAVPARPLRSMDDFLEMDREARSVASSLLSRGRALAI